MDRRTLLTAATAALVSACAPSLASFNRFVPRDGGARRVVESAAYGVGPRQTLDVFAPADVSGTLPIIMFFYGGSWSSGAKADYSFVGDALASRGFVVVIPDYRIAPDVFPSFLEDCAAATAWAHQHAGELGGNRDFMFLAGHSAGAYNAIMLALDARYLERAGAPISAIKGAAGLAGPYDFYPFDVDSTRAAFGQAADPAQTQPLHFARPNAPPLFLAWGDDDNLVRRKSIDNLATAQRAQGASVEAKIYPNVGHAGLLLALSRPLRGRAPVLDDMTAFIRRGIVTP